LGFARNWQARADLFHAHKSGPKRKGRILKETTSENIMKVPLLDLRAQYLTVKDEVLAAVAEVLESQVCIGGPKVAELEREIAAISDCKYGVAVSSGTDALLCSLMSLSIGARDEVITTPFSFFATAGCISRVGAKPVFVDIDPKTYNINPSLIEAVITRRTKAIIPVHLFGQIADMDPIMDIANRRGLFVIEDAAQSISATYKGRKAGSMGITGCFSFFPSKNLGAAGDAGLIVTNDEELYERMSMIRSHGAKPKYYHKYVGGNFRLDPIQAAILLVKLPHLNAWSEARRRNAARYDQLFAGNPLIQTPYIRPDCVSIFNQYVVRVGNRDEVLNALREAGVSSEIYYPLPLHLQECFARVVARGTRFPVAERAAEQVLALPVYPELTPEMINYVADKALAACSKLQPSHA
jgi:dTDP-4-amino-4,6-dideoxygalactose transaminase